MNEQQLIINMKNRNNHLRNEILMCDAKKKCLLAEMEHNKRHVKTLEDKQYMEKV